MKNIEMYILSNNVVDPFFMSMLRAFADLKRLLFLPDDTFFNFSGASFMKVCLIVPFSKCRNFKNAISY